MSLILRFRRHLLIRSPLVSRIGDRRSLVKPASQSDEEEEEMDQRKLPTDYDPATFYPTEHRSPPTERVFRLVEEISSLKLSEVSDLSEILMKKKGITVVPNVAVTMVQGQSVGVSEEAKA